MDISDRLTTWKLKQKTDISTSFSLKIHYLH